MKNLIHKIPKTELHIHIEGTFEPELMFHIAKRNNIKLKYSDVTSLRSAYDFNCLQDFLDIYYEGAKVLITEQDFYDLTKAYLKRAVEDHVVHTEIFFDPQTHLERGVSFPTFFNGIHRACKDAEKKWGIGFHLIMCFLRHLDEKNAFDTLEKALPFKEHIIGIGLDSSESGNPPSKFKNVFKEVKDMGFKILAHAGEEGPPAYIWEAIKLLNVSRIDHGNQCINDPSLTEEIIKRKLALTMCPLSNIKLGVINDLNDHPARELMDKGVMVTINSDDPAYFGGYINDNYRALALALNLSKDEIIQLAKNSVSASFMNPKKKERFLKELDAF